MYLHNSWDNKTSNNSFKGGKPKSIQPQVIKKWKNIEISVISRVLNVCVNPYHYKRVVSSGIDLSDLTLSSSSHNSVEHDNNLGAQTPSVKTEYGAPQVPAPLSGWC